jgi:serine acetyltransferase
MADDGLTQDFDAHALFTFMVIPREPPLANRAARVKRWFLIAFAESWLAVYLYRLKLRLRSLGLPLVPGVCDLVSRALFRVQIGDHVRVGRGLMLTHGNVVIDGRTTIGKNCQINPWVTIGLSNSKRLGFSIDGPTIGNYVHIGTGAKILGPISIGDYARIGANAVVVGDVPANTTVVGMPARPIGARRTPRDVAADGDPAARDARLAAHMREAIAEYRMHRQSLEALVDTLYGSFDVGSDRLHRTRARLADDLAFLEGIAAVDGGQTPPVVRALETIDGELTKHVARAG